ncbi:hypothetical protein B4133_2870 [Bacillus altitudinis]|uniref:hypothetical protein n=1 Tax=Bacillus altitudinis TaxID=293387 RepID=UPI0005979734|nr:hypothetical protein [Bacillus altitudinis]KIL26294.1 hypothetical protein B4133_2870 [Bacillus altitudinis]
MFSFDDQDLIQMLSLGTDSEVELGAMKEKKVEFRKYFGQLLSQSRKNAKSNECFYCGEKCSSFCNSHSIPAFFLRNIAHEGVVYNNNKLINMPLLDDDIGINKTGTFQLICRDCDSKIFSDYENPDNYEATPTSKMIAQIAMKNYLKSISKRKLEIEWFNNIMDSNEQPFENIEQKQIINNLDLQEYIEGFNRAKRVEKKGWENEYYLFYHQKLDYVVPIAFQSTVALLADFEGNIINNIYNYSPEYQIKSVHICVFPLESSSVIMMFVDSKEKRYRSFYKQFRKLPPEKKLAAINFIIFSYSEDVYIQKKINEKVLKDPFLVDVSRKSLELITPNPIIDVNPLLISKENVNFDKMHEIPNLLLKEFKVR